MNTKTYFEPTDRYIYDWEYCTTTKGYAQFDTTQDAHYFSIWVNPFELRTITYAEGDVTTKQAETVEEFKQELKEMKDFYNFRGIDPGFNEELKQEFTAIGCHGYLH